MSKFRRRHLLSLAVVGVVMAIAPAGASAAVSCPGSIEGFVDQGVNTLLAGPCVSSIPGRTVYYDLNHNLLSPPYDTTHASGTPHYVDGTALVGLSTLAPPQIGVFDFLSSPGHAKYKSTAPVGSTDSWEFAATDDPIGSSSFTWTKYQALVHITSPTQTVFNLTPPASATQPVAASVETNGTSGGLSIAGRSRTVDPPAGWSIVGPEYFIEAPTQTAADPLKLTITLSHTLAQLQGYAGTPPIDIMRNGTVVPVCSAGHGTTAAPDPCVDSHDFVSGPGSDYRIVVLTSEASVWDVVMPVSADGLFTADVLPTLAISATPAVDFGAVSVGTMANGVPNPASVRVTANVPYDLSVNRTPFSGGADIPLKLAATAPASPVGAVVDPGLPGFIPTSSSLSVGARTTGITSGGGDEWNPVYTLGPVPFRPVGPTSSTVTYTVVAP